MSNVRDFGAKGDGKTDDTEAIQHCLRDGNGAIEFPRGEYLVSRTLVVELAKSSRFAMHGTGGTAKLIMTGSGPTLHLLGTHTTSADPNGFRPEEWLHERMPTVDSLEIEGRHPEADGIRIEGVMQPTLTGVLIRNVRTAVHVTKRARNILINHCHFYYNTGIGIHLDKVNLHQINITGNHISYNRLGGIRIEGSEIRNLQITGNDIEYNNNRSIKVPDADDVATAEIYVDVREGSVREGTIVSNTIQATYSKNGANIRFIGQGEGQNQKAGMWTISGNLIGSQENNVHLTSVRGITLTGNFIYSGHHRNLLVEDSKHIIVSGNCFEHNPDYTQTELCTGVKFVNSRDITISGMILQDCQTGKHTVAGAPELKRDGLLEFIDCQRINVSGSQILDAAPYGIYLSNCTDSLITGTTILDTRTEKLMQAAICWKGDATGSMVSGCRLGAGPEGTILSSGLQVNGNL